MRVSNANLTLRTLGLAVLFCCLWSGINVIGAEPTIEVRASATTVRVAEPFGVEINVFTDAGERVFFPNVSAKFGEFDVQDHEDLFDIPVTPAGDRRSWTRRLTLETINTGDQSIPELAVHVETAKGRRTLNSNPVMIRVKSVLENRADPTNFRDLQPLLDVEETSVRSYAWVWWSLGGMATAVICASVACIARRRASMGAADWAERELDDLEARVVSSMCDPTDAIGELSAIVREYVELQFGIGASRQTTSELATSLDGMEEISEEAAKQFLDLFTLADQTKYAGLELNPEHVAQKITDCRNRITSTK